MLSDMELKALDKQIKYAEDQKQEFMNVKIDTLKQLADRPIASYCLTCLIALINHAFINKLVVELVEANNEAIIVQFIPFDDIHKMFAVKRHMQIPVWLYGLNSATAHNVDALALSTVLKAKAELDKL